MVQFDVLIDLVVSILGKPFHVKSAIKHWCSDPQFTVAISAVLFWLFRNPLLVLLLKGILQRLIDLVDMLYDTQHAV